MGWITFHETRSAKEYFIDTYKEMKEVELIDIAVVGFRAVFIAVKDLQYGYTYAMIYMLHRAPKDYYNFGYKSMSEFCGPNLDNCPKRIIDKLTPLDEIEKLNPLELSGSCMEWATNWRKRCIDAKVKKAELNKALKSGVIKTKEPIEFTSGHTFQYFTKKGRKLYALKDYGTDFQIEIPVKIRGWKYIEHEIL